MRVIAGRFGGRTLVAPPGAATRPTADRVREALFSILGSVEGANILDLYAGTGALGIEAFSRGAARSTFVEQARPALRALRQNLDQLGMTREAIVLPVSVERALSAMTWGPDAFDLVFIDPPYALIRGGKRKGTLVDAVQGQLGPSVRTGGRVVLEHARADVPPVLAGFRLEDTRTYGDTALSFYLR